MTTDRKSFLTYLAKEFEVSRVEKFDLLLVLDSYCEGSSITTHHYPVWARSYRNPSHLFQGIDVHQRHRSVLGINNKDATSAGCNVLSANRNNKDAEEDDRGENLNFFLMSPPY